MNTIEKTIKICRAKEIKQVGAARSINMHCSASKYIMGAGRQIKNKGAEGARKIEVKYTLLC